MHIHCFNKLYRWSYGKIIVNIALSNFLKNILTNNFFFFENLMMRNHFSHKIKRGIKKKSIVNLLSVVQKKYALKF